MKKILIVGVSLAGIWLISMNINSGVGKAEKYTKTCYGGSATACNKLGLIYYTGSNNIEQDTLKAVELFKKACDGGNATGCTFLGFIYNNGIGVEYDTLKAVAFYTKACNGDDALGCKNLGVIYAKNDSIHLNLIK